MKYKYRFLIIILLIFLAFIISACSYSEIKNDFPGFFENIWLNLSNFWESIKLSLDNLLVSIADIFSGLSGIGEAMRNMFRNFSIF